MTKLLVLGLLDGGPMSGYDSSRSWAGRTRSGGAACFRLHLHALKKLEGEATSPWRGWSRRATGRRRSTGLPRRDGTICTP